MNHKHNKQSEAKLCRVEFPDTNYLCTLPGHWWGLTCWNKSYLKLFGHQDHQPSFWVLLLEDFFDQPQRSRAARTWKSWWNDFLRCTSGPSKQKMPGCESFPVLSNRKKKHEIDAPFLSHLPYLETLSSRHVGKRSDVHDESWTFLSFWFLRRLTVDSYIHSNVRTFKRNSAILLQGCTKVCQENCVCKLPSPSVVSYFIFPFTCIQCQVTSL